MSKFVPLSLVVVCSSLALGGAAPARAQAASGSAVAPLDLTSITAAPLTSSSSTSQPETPAATSPEAPVQSALQVARRAPAKTGPFRSIAFAAIIGIQGVGGEVATPLAPRLNLRGGAQLANVKDNLEYNGLSADAELSLENFFGSVDIFPFGNGFRISPGVTLHNDTHLFASLYAAGGSSFSLGDADYTSDPGSPINGIARISMGSSIAPRLTAGWGNMLSNKKGRFSVPFEIGFQYTSAPTVTLNLNGNGCDNTGDCGNINSGDGAQNIQAEITKLQKQLAPFRVYPLITTGISYRFGGGKAGVQ